MYIIDDIAYAGEPAPIIKVTGVRPLEDYKLWLRFNTGETKIYDFKPLLNTLAFQPLTDTSVFQNVYIDYGIPSWNDGAIDIDPEVLYKEGVPAEGAANA